MVGTSKLNFAHCGAGAEAMIQAIQLHDIPVISRPQMLPSQYPLNSNLTMRPSPRDVIAAYTLATLATSGVNRSGLPTAQLSTCSSGGVLLGSLMGTNRH
jgi:hypothetical protein